MTTTQSSSKRVTTAATPPAPSPQLPREFDVDVRRFRVPLGVIALVLAWSYWRPMLDLVARWWSEADYNHGFFVPIFAGYLLYHRRELRPLALKSSLASMIAGGLLVLIAGGLRIASLYFRYPLLEAMSLIPCLTGVVLLVGGIPMLRWAWPSLLFLIFMIPLPSFLTGFLSHPLQRIATISSTYILQTLGIPAFADGNVIRLTNGEIGVVEACSGMRMLIVFFTLTVGASFLIERPLWEKILIVLSAGIIGIIANVVRITATGIAHELVSREFADKLFHDFAGWLMMPLAMLILFGELWLLSRLLIPVETETAPRFARSNSGSAAR
ncbi:MAG: exosortase/archaeosortase family protein [Planctomycetaceae bacterium]